MSEQRPTIFTVSTPYPGASEVTLTEKTWEEHIVTFHPEMDGKTYEVAATLRNPVIVCTGDDPKVIFASDTYSIGGKPLVVCVKPDGKFSQVVTAYFGGLKYLEPYPGLNILWKKSSK